MKETEKVPRKNLKFWEFTLFVVPNCPWNFLPICQIRM